MNEPKPPVVYIVEDDDLTRSLMRELAESIGVACRTFASAQEFLARYDPAQPGCLVLDLLMPEMTGVELQEELNRRGAIIPVIFTTGHADVSTAVEAIRRGAFNYLQKPVRSAELLENVKAAISRDRRNRETLEEIDTIRSRISSLTPREREVMEHIVRGSANKVIAAEMILSQRTVELYRARVMEKMGADSVAQLVRMHLDFQRYEAQRPRS